MATIPTYMGRCGRNGAAYIDLSDGATFARGLPLEHFVWARACNIYGMTQWMQRPTARGFRVISGRNDAMAVIPVPATLSSDEGPAAVRRLLRDRAQQSASCNASSALMKVKCASHLPRLR
jgi:hypothetical protein